MLSNTLQTVNDASLKKLCWLWLTSLALNKIILDWIVQMMLYSSKITIDVIIVIYSALLIKNCFVAAYRDSLKWMKMNICQLLQLRALGAHRS